MDALNTANTIAIVAKIIQPLMDVGLVIAMPSAYNDYVLLEIDFFHDTFDDLGYEVEPMDKGKMLKATLQGIEFISYEVEE